METRKMFSLFEHPTVYPLGYFLDEEGEFLIPPPVFSIQDGKIWIEILKQYHDITDEQASNLIQDLESSGLPKKLDTRYAEAIKREMSMSFPYIVILS